MYVEEEQEKKDVWSRRMMGKEVWETSAETSAFSVLHIWNYPMKQVLWGFLSENIQRD